MLVMKDYRTTDFTTDFKRLVRNVKYFATLKIIWVKSFYPSLILEICETNISNLDPYFIDPRFNLP